MRRAARVVPGAIAGRRHRTGPVIRTVAIFAVVIVVVSSIGLARASGAGGGNSWPKGINGAAVPYYPYNVPTGLFPAPDIAVPATPGFNVSLPQIAATGVGTVTNLFLVYVNTPTKGGLHTNLTVREASYSSSVAQGIVYGTTSRTMPLNWSVPYTIRSFWGACTASALAITPTANWMIAGITCGSSSYVYYSNGSVSNWTHAATVSGGSVQIGLDPDGMVVVTTISSGELYATTILFPYVAVGNPVAVGAVVAASPVFFESSSGFEEGIAAITTGGQTVFYRSTNGGASFQTISIAPVVNTGVSSIFNSIGSTHLAPSGGIAGQLAATTVGSSVFVFYTQEVGGTVQGEVLTSPNQGTSWQGPISVPLSVGAILDPTLTATATGYIDATFLATAGAGLSRVEQAAFLPDGQLVSPPAPVPGATAAWGSSVSEIASATVDSFQRPVVVWATPPTSTGSTINETGGFLSPANLATVLTTGVLNLTSSDIVPGGGSLGTFQSGVGSQLSTVVQNTPVHATASQLRRALNATSGVYQNVSFTSLNFSGETASGSGGHRQFWFGAVGQASLTAAVQTGPGYLPPSSHLVYSQGIVSPVTYLAVETDWLLAAEGLQAVGLANPLLNGTISSAVPVLPPNVPAEPYADSYNVPSSATVTATIENPTTVQLASVGSFATYAYTNHSSQQLDCSGTWTPVTRWTTSDVPSSFTDTVTVDGLSHHSFTSSSWIPTIYLQNLSAGSQHNWTITLNATYTETNSTVVLHPVQGGGCSPNGNNRQISPVVNGPSSVSMAAGSSFTTTLVSSPSAIEAGAGSLEVKWVNSMEAWGVDHLSGYKVAASNSSQQFDLFNYFNYTGLTPGYLYNLTVNTSSQSGQWNPALTPWYAAGTTRAAPPQTFETGCSFTYVPMSITLSGLTVTMGGNNTATVSWTGSTGKTSDPGLGVLVYYEIGTSTNLTALAASSGAGPSYTYTVELHGLAGGALYYLTASITSSVGGCLYLKNTTSAIQELGQGFMLSPVAYPYDSISRTGGGEGIEAALTPSLNAQLSAFTGGSLVYGPKNGSGPNVSIPLSPPLSSLSCGADCYLVNITPTVINATYAVQEIWNFSFSGASISLYSAPVAFVYLRDTSGDGLTDVEKLDGWTVTYTDFWSTAHNELVTADPSAFATNRLVGDYVEKEFGLNPYTVDTAESGMLDTWNLTFDLRGNQQDGFGLYPFALTNEDSPNNPYNPFSTSVSYSPGLYESGQPLHWNGNEYSNLTPSPTGGIYGGDGSPWAAEVLWSPLALEHFYGIWVNTPPLPTGGTDEFRAVLGQWNGIPTLTVWGKLSWGADPLACSTPNDQIADGARVNAANPVGLSVTISNLYVSNLWVGQGYAAMLRPYAGATATGSPEFTNYSAPANLNGGVGRLTGYTVVLPVSQTSQYETLQLEVLANVYGNSTLTPIAFNNGATVVNLTYDMIAGWWLNKTFNSGQVNSRNGSLSIEVRTQTVDQKTNTFLWVPTANGTTNGLPPGLARYIGEQSFDLVVVNSSGWNTSHAIPYPGGGSYTLTLQPGLNNFLIPREQFLDSAFGEAILQGRPLLPATNTSSIPIVSANPNDAGVLTRNFGSQAGLLYELGAYWQNLSVAPNGAHTGNFSSVTEKGTGASSSSKLEVMVAQIALANNSGGLASNQNVYAQDNLPEPPALQAVVTLNITAPAYLDLLVASLLDNTTLGVNGSFQTVTGYAGSLGLDPSVMHALANGVITGQGLYGPPPYNVPPPPKNQFGSFWNACTAVVTNPLGAILSLGGLIYNGFIAAGTYFSHLVVEALAIGGQVLNRVAATLVSVGDAILSALSELLNYIISLIKAFIAAALVGLKLIMDGFWSAEHAGLVSGFQASWSFVQGGASLAQATAAMLPGLIMSLIPAGMVTGMVYVVAGLAAPFSIGVGVVMSLVLAGVLTALSVGSGPSGNGILSAISAGAAGLVSGSASAISALADPTFNITEKTIFGSSSRTSNTVQPYQADPPDFFGAMAVITTGGGFLAAGIKYKAPTMGLLFAFAALIVALQEVIDFDIGTNNGQNCNQLAVSDGQQLVNITEFWMIWAVMLAVVGGAYSVTGLIGAAGFLAGLIDAIGLLASIAAAVFAILEWNQVKSCASPGY